jgi:hypothetical protein
MVDDKMFYFTSTATIMQLLASILEGDKAINERKKWGKRFK